MPANTFPGQNKPRNTLGFIMAVIASISMDTSTAYKIVKALLYNLKDLRAGYKGLRNFDSAKTG